MYLALCPAPGALFQHHLDSLKGFHVNDRFMGIFDHDPLRFREPHRLFRLVADLHMSPLHQISCVGLIMEHLVHRRAAPKSYIPVFRSNVIVNAVHLLIGCRAWDLLIVEDARDFMCSYPAESH